MAPRINTKVKETPKKVASKKRSTKTDSLVRQISSAFGLGTWLNVILEVALTSQLSAETQRYLGPEGLRQATEDQDLIVKFSAVKAWGLRPNGRELLADALDLLARAARSTLTKRYDR
jgi:hypothetical protein